MIELDKHPRALELSLWIVVVAAGGSENAHVEFYQSRTVAYEKQEALQAVLKQLASEQPELHTRGNTMGGWRATHIEGIPARTMEKLFKDRAEAERRGEAELRSMEQNKLLQAIIEKKDIALFNTALRDGRINNYERLYLHDKLTEDGILSPIKL